MFPDKERLVVCFAHAAYRLQDRFALRQSGIQTFEVRSSADLERRIEEPDVLVISGMWSNDLIARAKRLHFIQSISSGINQYSVQELRARGIRLASAQGVNARAVSEHAMALILALSRRLAEARDNQSMRVWRGMIGDLSAREDELCGKTLLVIGLGRIGGRLARLAKAFGLYVIGVRRDPTSGRGDADEVHSLENLRSLLPRADYVVLTCPLVPETEGLLDTETFSLMKRSAYLVNVARGDVVDESALIEALSAHRIAGAALDCTHEEPLPSGSPLWGMANVLLTPHTAGETRQYEDNVLDVLQDNLSRLWRGDSVLRNQIV